MLNNESYLTNISYTNLAYLQITYACLSLIGLVLNGLIVAAVSQCLTLQSRCGRYVQQMAISDVIFCASFAAIACLNFVLEMKRPYFRLTALDCALWCAVNMASFHASTGFTILVGTDRLLGLISPKLYGRLPESTVLGVTVLSWLFGITFAIFAANSAEQSTVISLCSPPAAMSDTVLKFWGIFNFSSIIYILVVYSLAITVAYVRLRSACSTLTEMLIRQSILTLSVVAAVCLIGDGGVWTAMIILHRFTNDKETIIAASQYLGGLLILKASGDFFLFYWRSADYRGAFRSILRLNTPETNRIARDVHSGFLERDKLMQYCEENTLSAHVCSSNDQRNCSRRQQPSMEMAVMEVD